VDKQFVISGTGSFVEQGFGFWSDSQGFVVDGAAAQISFDGGTNVISLTPGTATASIAYSDHVRSSVWVRGVGATVTVFASSRST